MMDLCEVARFVLDVDAAAKFYETLLGAAPIHRGAGIAVFRAGRVTFLIHERYEPGPDDPPCEDHVAFQSSDVRRAAAALEAQGIVIERPPHDYQWGRSAYLRDPGGQLIELIEERAS